ncbi:MAG TPA: hypothetical protein VKM55_08325 [Candidatus Lokiarchaeia archaeon]|nr:hypothetical protein [Candidatus Lokiarchaeia archaeon]
MSSLPRDGSTSINKAEEDIKTNIEILATSKDVRLLNDDPSALEIKIGRRWTFSNIFLSSFIISLPVAIIIISQVHAFTDDLYNPVRHDAEVKIGIISSIIAIILAIIVILFILSPIIITFNDEKGTVTISHGFDSRTKIKLHVIEFEDIIDIKLWGITSGKGALLKPSNLTINTAQGREYLVVSTAFNLIPLDIQDTIKKILKTYVYIYRLKNDDAQAEQEKSLRPATLYCPLCDTNTTIENYRAISGREVCSTCGEPLHFTARCEECDHVIIKPISMFASFKAAGMKCEKCGAKMKLN